MDSQNARVVKFGVALSLICFAGLTLLHANQTVIEGPFFFRRLARLKYALNSDPSLYRRPGPWSSFLSISGRSGGDITAVSTGVAAGAAQQIILSSILGIPLNTAPYIPIISIGGACTAFLLVDELVNRRLGLVSGSLVLLYTSRLAHFHEYQYGRLVFMSLFFYFVARLLKSRRTESTYVSFFGIVISQLALKFSAPGAEVVTLNALLFLVVASFLFYNNSISENLLPIVTLLAIVFVQVNPKFYHGVLLGVAEATGPVSVARSGGPVEQILSMREHFSQILTGTQGGSEYGYNPTASPIQSLPQRVYTLFLVGVVGIYGLHTLVRTLWDREWSRRFMIVSGFVVGMSANLFYRAVLLGRFGAKGLQIVLATGGVIALYRYLSQRSVVTLGVCLMLLISVSAVAGTVVSPGKPYRYATAEQTATWEQSYVPSYSRQLMDYSLYGNLAYYYGKHGLSEYWNVFPITSWNESRMRAFIEGNPRNLSAEYVVVDRGMASYATKPRTYASYEPLKPYLETANSQPGLAKVYTNGPHVQFQVGAGNFTSSRTSLSGEFNHLDRSDYLPDRADLTETDSVHIRSV
jgi:uncharacterized membrane protein